MAKGGGDQPAKGKPKGADKVVEDKLFGMKNKGGKRGQEIAKQLANTAASLAEKSKAERAKEERRREKAASEEAQRELSLLMNRSAQEQKVPFGVDPKTVMCKFFKLGNCEKGKKCKFSHDPDVDRKTDKKNLYQDTRKEEDDQHRLAETSADWDLEKLQSVVLSKKGNQRTSTDKVCKFFIQAIEDGKYGWFWVCPNGGDKCMYRHALPPGFVVKTKEQRAAEKALLDKSPLKTLTLEEFLESERHKLTGTLTPVTEESFAKWKKERMDKKIAEEQLRKAREATGRALFESGNWRTTADADGDDGGDDDEEDDEEEDDEDGVWNLEKMRRETEMLRAKKEEERLAALHGGPANPSVWGGNAVVGEAEPETDEPPDIPETEADAGADAEAEAGRPGS